VLQDTSVLGDIEHTAFGAHRIAFQGNDPSVFSNLVQNIDRPYGDMVIPFLVYVPRTMLFEMEIGKVGDVVIGEGIKIAELRTKILY
jgi:hypothetical protein